jgi:translation initiation factor 2 subunit 3
VIRKCPKCQGADAYTIADKCLKCGTASEPLMRISLIDAPGHETLMATAIAGSSVIDGILFVIAANEPCPMQQTKEHLMIINLLGSKNVVVVQSKVDIVGKEGAVKHYNQIKEFLKGSAIENAPIVPVMTNQGINVDVILERIAGMQVPRHDPDAQPLMYVVRSFDVNKPGSDAERIKGGVIGGAILKGRFKVGDRIEIRPGAKMPGKSAKKDSYSSLITTIVAISNGTEEIREAMPGGLIGISTEVDPTFTKADGLVGNVVGHVGKLPESQQRITIKYHKLARTDIPEQGIKEDEAFILGVGTATTIGYVKRAKRDEIELELKRPIAAEKGSKIAVMRNIAQRWRLAGYGTLN